MAELTVLLHYYRQPRWGVSDYVIANKGTTAPTSAGDAGAAAADGPLLATALMPKTHHHHYH